MTRKTYSHEPGLIQDITYSTTDPNYRNGKVHTSASIGELNDIWQRQADTAYHGLGTLPYSTQGVAAPTAQKSNSLYNPALRVAPLSLHAARLSDGILERAGQWLSRSAILVWLALSAFVERGWVKTSSVAQTYLPKNYSLASGAYTDWRRAFIGSVKRVGIPAGAVAILLILAFALPSNHPASPSTKKGHNPTVTVNTAADGKPESRGTSTGSKQGATPPTNRGISSASTSSHSLPVASSGSSGSASSGQGSTPSIPGSYTPPTTYSGGTIGGYGGGSSGDTGGSGGSNTVPISGPSAPTLGGIPGVTTPYSVTMPGQTADLNGKPVVSTSPTTTTLN